MHHFTVRSLENSSPHFSAECLLVKLDCLFRSLDHKVRRDGVIALGYCLYSRCHLIFSFSSDVYRRCRPAVVVCVGDRVAAQSASANLAFTVCGLSPRQYGSSPLANRRPQSRSALPARVYRESGSDSITSSMP